jgi:hypothetical protein
VQIIIARSVEEKVREERPMRGMELGNEENGINEGQEEDEEYERRRRKRKRREDGKTREGGEKERGEGNGRRELWDTHPSIDVYVASKLAGRLDGLAMNPDDGLSLVRYLMRENRY